MSADMSAEVLEVVTAAVDKHLAAENYEVRVLAELGRCGAAARGGAASTPPPPRAPSPRAAPARRAESRAGG